MKWPSLRICRGIVSDQLVTDSQQLHFNDSIFNYQYPPLSVQPFSATSFSIFFFRCFPASWPGVLATQCTIATSWDVANAFNSNYLCWLLSGRRRRPKGKGIPFQVESPALRFVAKGLTLWASGNKSGKCIHRATGYCVYMSGIKIVTRWLFPYPYPTRPLICGFHLGRSICKTNSARRYIDYTSAAKIALGKKRIKLNKQMSNVSHILSSRIERKKKIENINANTARTCEDTKNVWRVLSVERTSPRHIPARFQ